MPQFVVILEPGHTPSSLNKKLPTINHVKVRWNNYKTKRQVIQCRRCLKWGHVTSNCFTPADTCVKCAGKHTSSSLSKAPGCACSLAIYRDLQRASNTECIIYQETLAKKTATIAAATRGTPPAPRPQRFILSRFNTQSLRDSDVSVSITASSGPKKRA